MIEARADDAAASFDPLRRKRFDQWAGRFLQSAVDVVAGQRSATQLVRWMQEEVYEDLVRRAQLVRGSVTSLPGRAATIAGPTVRPSITSLHTSFVAATTCEAAAVVRYGARHRAIAARFELIEGRMQCTALEWA